MANQLKMVSHQAIIGLLRRNWSYRRVAAELGIDRDTVSRHAKAAAALDLTTESGLPVPITGPPPADPNAAIVITGSSGPGPESGTSENPSAQSPPDSNAAIVITGSAALAAGSPGAVAGGPTADADASPGTAHAGQQSRCEPWREVIAASVDAGLTARRIWQDLRDERGFDGDYQSVQRFVRRLRGAVPLPFRRMECAPGDEAQIDFGKGAPIVTPDGKRRQTHLFRIVLSCSRKAYSEVVFSQTTELFLRCIENAFIAFGGVTRTSVVDNLKAAVIRADWYDPELNPKLRAFCEHYGTVLLPTRPRTPRHKGKVERGVGYAQSNALRGRSFTSLAGQNLFLREWEATIADTRIHGTTRKQVSAMFAEVEKPALLPLPPGRFPSFQEAQRIVNRDGHVEVSKAYYSAPPEFVGRTLWARWDGHTVRLFDQKFQQVAIHAQREPGRFSTSAAHIAPAKRSGLERGAAWWLGRAQLIGEHAGQWAQSQLQERGVHAVRALMGLVSLTGRHPAADVERACRVAQSHGGCGLRDIRKILKHPDAAAEQTLFDFATEHPLIRPLSTYDKIIQDAFDQTRVSSS